MTDRDALLAAVVAAPDDDLPRLVAADFLEERDPDDRLAAAIRFEGGSSVWCREPSGWAFQSGDPLPAPVFDSHLATIDQLGDLAWPGDTRFTFRRGFVESVSCPAAAWLARGDDVLKQHPVRRVRLTTGVFNLADVVERAIRNGFRPPSDQGWGDGSMVPVGTPMAELLRWAWPGVEFELPPPGWRDFAEQYTEIPEADLIDRMRRAMDGWT